MAASLSVDGGTGAIGYYDTLAQSFYVDGQMHATKIDLYFSGVDVAAPVELSIRTIENGIPSSTVLVNSVVVKAVADITISTDGSVATTFTFPVPVLLDVGQYCFTLSSSSSKNRLFVSTLGADDLVTGARISKNSLAGIMYVSSDGLNWNGDQTRDIKFTLYRAKFSASNAVVDLIIDPSDLSTPTITNLPFNPFTSYSGSAVVKVTHPRHGFQNSNYVKFFNLPDWFTYLNNTSANVSINNIPIQYLCNTSLVVSNVTSEAYTVVLGTNTYITGNITSGTFGGISVTSTNILPYSVLYPAISSTVPAKTNMVHSIQTVDSDYALRPLTYVDPTNVEFNDSSRVILDTTNASSFAGGATSFLYRLQLNSTNQYISPVINKDAASITFITPDINKPSASDVLPIDYKTITSGNVFISFDTANSQSLITIAKADVQANAKIMVQGANVVISGAGNAYNNGDFTITSIKSDGSNFTVSNPKSVTEPAGNAITIVYKPTFISDTSPVGTSSRAKYVTRKISLANPSTALLVRFAVTKPPSTVLRAFYKIQAVGTDKLFQSKNFTEIDLTSINDTVDGQYVDIERYLPNLVAFNAVVVKLVLQSDSVAYYPKVKDLRIIAFA